MHPHIHGQTLSRSDFEALVGGENRTLSECVFDQADLSGLDLNGGDFRDAVLNACSLRATIIFRPRLLFPVLIDALSSPDRRAIP